MRRSTPRHHIVERCVPRGHAALTESNKSLIFMALGDSRFQVFCESQSGSVNPESSDRHFLSPY